jgi:hypothetical protein
MPETSEIVPQPWRPQHFGRKMGLGLLLVLVLASAGIYERQRHSRAAGRSSSAPAHTEPIPLDRLPADTLFDAYGNDAALADEKYKGKRFTITSQVVKVEQSDTVSPTVLLGSALEPVIATGISQTSALALAQGAPVEVDCVVTGSVAELPTLDCGPHGVVRPIKTEAAK